MAATLRMPQQSMRPGEVMAHPVFALLRTSLADDLDAWLDRGERKVRAWYARHKAVEVPISR